MLNQFVASLLMFVSTQAMATVPMGQYTLAKGPLACPAQLQLEQKPNCGGYLMIETASKVETDLCNVNSGKYLRRWKEEDLKFIVETQTKEAGDLLQVKELRRAFRNSKVVRKTQNNHALHFRGGRLELDSVRAGKATTCLYKRDLKPESLSASAQ